MKINQRYELVATANKDSAEICQEVMRSFVRKISPASHLSYSIILTNKLCIEALEALLPDTSGQLSPEKGVLKMISLRNIPLRQTRRKSD